MGLEGRSTKSAKGSIRQYLRCKRLQVHKTEINKIQVIVGSKESVKEKKMIENCRYCDTKHLKESVPSILQSMQQMWEDE